MPSIQLVLVVTKRSANLTQIESAIRASGISCQLCRASGVTMAIARIAGGGVSSVILDISAGAHDRTEALEGIAKLRAAAPDVPIVVWSDPNDSNLGNIILLTGAQGCATAITAPSELNQLLASALKTGHRAPPEAARTSQNSSRAASIAVMGVKGGVGATTVAMNLAAALSRRGSVILAEIRPMLGSLSCHFQPGRTARGLHWRAEAQSMAAEIPMLWPVPEYTGLRVLFGPQSAGDCGEIDPPQAQSLFRSLSAKADFLVIDLPSTLSTANQTLIGASQYLAMVLAPNPICMRLGRQILDGIQVWDTPPSSIGSVVVKCSSEGVPASSGDIEAELGVPILKIIPPAPEFCLRGEREHAPMIHFDPDSLFTDSFVALSRCVQSRAR